MEKITLADIVRVTCGKYQGASELLLQPIADIITDSRKVTSAPGALFAALPGSRVDGHDFAASALQDGALAVLGQRELDIAPYIRVADSERALGDIARYYRSLFPVTLIGVSGSVGKTTCKEMLSAVLGQAYPLLKTEGNFNNALGLPFTLFRLSSAHRVAVVEMGISDFGEMSYLADIARPDLAVLTNIGEAHLEQLHDRNGVLRAKTELAAYLPVGGTLFANGDDDMLSAWQPPGSLRRVLFGCGANCNVRAEAVSQDARGISCRINGAEFASSVGGAHLVYSMLAAYAVGRELGLNEQQIDAGIRAYQPLPGRGNVTETALCRLIDHTYNANPSSMRAALNELAQRGGRRVAILGDMYELGADQAALHRAVGEHAANCADVLCCVGELAAEIGSGWDSDKPCFYFATVEDIITALPNIIQQHDNVLVKASNSLHLRRVAEAIEKLR